MFEPTSRVENLNGIRFYEQDILYDKFYYTRDLTAEIILDFCSPGFGIVIAKKTKNEIPDDLYLLKIGYKEVSFYHLLNGFQKILAREAINIYPFVENMNFYIKKDGVFLKLYVNKKLITTFKMGQNYDQYLLGIYSNAGNTIKSISIINNIPKYYNINMKNTNGGHLNFFQNGFCLLDCLNAAEIEMPEISLKSGTYYLNYLSLPANTLNDLKCYVYKYNDDKFYDNKKSLLKNNTFTLLEDSKISVKFIGTNGVIKNINISKYENNKYTPTIDTQIEYSESFIKINLKDIIKIEWLGNLQNYTENNHYILKGIDTIKFNDLNIKLDTNYKYVYENKLLSIYKNNELIVSKDCNSKDDITLFYNCNASINNLKLYKKDGIIENVNLNIKSKKFIPGTITGPIIALNEFNEPLDLSSSYRYVEDSNKYIFTNTERELFKADTKIKLQKDVVDYKGSIKIYGIYKNTNIDVNKIFNIKTENDFRIDNFCKNYDVIEEADLRYIDKAKGELFFYDYDKYSYFIVDYVKDNSYCINYDYNLKGYNVEISYNSYITNTSQNCYLLYNYNKETESSSDYILLKDINSNNIVQDAYVVLERR